MLEDRPLLNGRPKRCGERNDTETVKKRWEEVQMQFANDMIAGKWYAVTQIDIWQDGQMVRNFFGASSKKSLWRLIKF
jgi:hypothetical protein